MTTPIPPRIWTYQDGDVHRIADDRGRRYYVEGGSGFWAEERYAQSPEIWDRFTGFSEREAVFLVDALKREQRALAVADKLAAGLAAFGDVTTAAREWLSRRRDD